MTVAVEPGAPARALGSVLESVVVYAQGAVCTRRARFTLPEDHCGELRIRVGDVPLSAYAQSLRGSVVAGPDGLRVADVRPHLEAAVVEPEDMPGLLRAVKEAEDRTGVLHARRERLNTQIQETAALRAVPAKPRRDDPYPRPAAVEPVLALADFIAERLDTLHTRVRALDDEYERAFHELVVARHRLEEASGSLRVEQTRTTGAAVLTLDMADAAGDGASADVVVDLEYQVPGARWVQQYQLRLDPAMTGGTLVMRAAVAQRTGEDWTGVRLGLSTADLDRRTDLPELRSLRIGRRQAAPAPSGWREPPSGLEELFSGYDAGMRKRREHQAYARPAAPAAEYLEEDDGMDWMGEEQARSYSGAAEAALPVSPPQMSPPPAPMAMAAPASPAQPSGVPAAYGR
ncbi:MAG: DUF4139 domain-containing protein, partial [Streptomycetaceae bacterium]|nr:DUF4139 domain-containing protein [Streptomycetaceae bacterium]